MIEDDIRSRLLERSRDIPPIEPMRERVRAAARASYEQGESRRRRFRRPSWPLLAAAALVVCLGVLLVVIDGPESERNLVVTTTIAEPLDGAVAEAVGLAAGKGLAGIELSLAGTPAEVVSSRPDRLEIAIAPDSTATLHVIRLADTTASEVEQSIRASSSDTVLVDLGTTTIGGRPARTIEMVSGLGTSQVGFRLTPTTFVGALGINRRHQVVLVDLDLDSSPHAVAFWADTQRDGGSDARSTAAQLLQSVLFSD